MDPPLATPHMQAEPLAAARRGERLYGRRERLALAAGGLLLLLIVAASGAIALGTGADLSDASRKLATRSATRDMIVAVLSAETGQRGYLLTGRAEYLAPYSAARAKLPGMLDALAARLSGDADWPAWRRAIENKLAELGETVRLEQAGRHAEALALVQSDRGQRDMATARIIAARITARQSAAITDELRRSRVGAEALVAVDAVAMALLLALAAFVARSLRRTMGDLSRSRRSLMRANGALELGRERLEAAVAERTAELTNANAEIQRFAYIVSHDLRAPLLNIIGFTGELEHAAGRLADFVNAHLQAAGIVPPDELRQASEQDLPEAIRFIRGSTAKMDRLITAILRLSREGQRVLVPETLDMNRLLGGIIDSMRHQSDEAGATISLGDLPPLVADGLAVEQVFSNLVENALKYRAPDRAPHIGIEGHKLGATRRYVVSDNGRGIAPRDRERIFELFRRAGPQDVAGEGIGLAHVQALLRRLGGSIECQSQPGQGSRFIVTLAAGNESATPGVLEPEANR